MIPLTLSKGTFMNPETPGKQAGLYIHIPFCLKKCLYCDFFSITDLTLFDEFINALLAEMALAGKPDFVFDTIYLGGGTPSLLEPSQAAKILSAAYKRFNISTAAEITMEVNPGTATLSKLKEYNKAGVNRINIGIQSFQDYNLNFLGRIHSAADAVSAIQTARDAGFDNVGLDLIYGLPEQGIESWIADLKKTVKFRPEHLSCYILTYEKRTLLDQARNDKCFVLLPETAVGTLFEITAHFLADNGYKQYEISNFALDEKIAGTDRRSRHNQKYWSNIPYIGLGPSAHSYIEPARWWNTSNLEEYTKFISENRTPISGKELLTREQRIMESIFLGLRMSEGIDIEKFEQRFGLSFYDQFGKTVSYLEEKGYLAAGQARCALTPKGLLLHDSVTAMIV
jgi:oxygen-independent coproporphyrinogen-3 oxidase